jgi:N-acetylmuramic acid 6-phosphate etherase
MITTTAFVRIGKAYENMMVDLLATSEKLVERSRRTVMIVTGCDRDTATRAIEQAGRSVKTAIVMLKSGATRAEAEARLAAAQGFVRAALAARGGKDAR